MIISIGESVIDFKGQDYYIGGCPLNTAVSVSRLGSSVAYLGEISGDLWGEKIISLLQENSITYDKAFCDSKHPTMTCRATSVNGINTYVFDSKGSTAFSASSEKLKNFFLLHKIQCVFVGSVSLIDWITRANIIEAVDSLNCAFKFFDPNIRPGLIDDKDEYLSFISNFCGECDLVKVSEEDISYMGFSEQELLEKCKKHLVVTRGSGGSTWYSKDRNLTVNCPCCELKSSVVDTIGCGDTFNGAIMAWLDKNNKFDDTDLNEEEIKSALVFANRCASLNCLRQGCNPPYLSEITK